MAALNEDDSNRISTDEPEDVPLLRTDRCRTQQKRDVLAAVIACLGAISMGMVLGYSSPAMTNLDLRRLLRDGEKRSWFGSLIAVGAIAGGPLGAVFVERLGRKMTLMMCSFPLGIGWYLIVYGYEYIIVFCGRIFTGIGMGMVSVAAPLYVAEIASKERRGMLGAGFQLFVNVGILLVYVLGTAMNWNWLAVCGIAVAAVNVILLLVVPETPRFLIGQRERDEAMLALKWIYGRDHDNAGECDRIEENLHSESTEFSLRDFLQPGAYKPLLIAIGLMFFQQTSGINTVIFYTTEIFDSAGYHSNPAIPTIIIGAVLVASCVVSCILMDYAGRRILLLVSGLLMTVSIIALGLYYYFTNVKHISGLSWLPLLSLIVYIMFFSVGWGPIPWLVMSEIFPVQTRGFSCGVSACFNWVMAFIITKEFLALENSITIHGTFWLYGGFIFVGQIFVWFFLPETKGRSLEEIRTHFE